VETRYRWNDNVATNFIKIICESVVCIKVAQDRI